MFPVQDLVPKGQSSIVTQVKGPQIWSGAARRLLHAKVSASLSLLMAHSVAATALRQVMSSSAHWRQP